MQTITQNRGEHMEHIEIQMLGAFSLRTQSGQISDSENRSRKIWLLLAYLIYHRPRVIPQNELMDLLWGDEPRGTNPVSTLKTALHRVRSMLDHLWPNAGHQLILRGDDGYGWNPEFSIKLDTEEFERLCHMDIGSSEDQLNARLEALKLYSGDFLNKLSAHSWPQSLSAHYHELYLKTLLNTLPSLERQGRQKEIALLCKTASSLEPCHAEIHTYWMRSLLELGNQDEAYVVYQELSDRLLSRYGTLPTEELRALAREASRAKSSYAVTIDAIAEDLQETSSPAGAQICEYDFFVTLCRSLARSISRSKEIAHIALISVTDEDGSPLSKRSLPYIMDNLEVCIRTNLRRGDAAARCSASQYILLLPQANYANSNMVCSRITKSFARQYPHSPANFQQVIYPLSPNP